MEWLYDLAKKGVELAKDLFLALAARFYGYQPEPRLPSPVEPGEILVINGQRFRIETVRIDKDTQVVGYWAVPA